MKRDRSKGITWSPAMKLSIGLSVVTVMFIGLSSVLVIGDGKIQLTSADLHPEFDNVAASDEYEKRNFGRWKNLRWQVQKSLNNHEYQPDSYAIDKRFSSGGGVDGLPYNLGVPYYIYSPESESQMYPDTFDSVYPFDGMGYDKRHSSRWNIILRKLGSLSSLDGNTEGKRSASSCRMIQNKLNQLSDKPDFSAKIGTGKRNPGRWRNTN